MNRLQRLRAELEKLLADARAILDAAEAEKRDLKEDEAKNYDDLLAQAEAKRSDIQRVERIDVLEQQPTRQAQRPVPQDAATVGMGRRDVQRYSLVRAIRAAMTNDWRGAELEREASEATAQRLGRQPQGSFFVPADWLESRDLLVGTPSAGGNAVA